MPSVRLLGGIAFDAVQASNALMSRPKCLVLIAWLSSHCDSGPRRREEVLRLFWGDKDSQLSRNSLRQALFNIRRALGADAIIGQGESFLLNTELVTCDLIELDRALRDGRDEDALELYRGDLLHGLVVPNADALTQWIADAQRSRRTRVLEAATRLAAKAEAAEDVSLTLRWARRAAELMTVEERPKSQLASLLARAEAAQHQIGTTDHFGRLLDEATRERSQGGALPKRQERLRLATLPLLNMSGDTSDDALAEGLSRAVADEVGETLPGVEQVAPRSMHQLQSIASDSAASGSRLQADAVLSGLMRRHDGEVSIAIELRDRGGDVVWADRMDGPEIDMDRLVHRIASGLTGVLPNSAKTPREVRRVRRDGRDPRVVVSVLRGHHYVWRLTPPDLEKAMASFTEALQHDPESAPAWAGLGQTLLFLPIYSPNAPIDAYTRAIEVLDKALALDPHYATACAARGVAASVAEWQFGRAGELIDLAHTLDPSDPEAWVADLLYARAPLNKGAESLTAAARLVELDPASPLSLAYAAIGTAFFDPDVATRYAQDALQLEPGLAAAQWCLTGLAAGRGDIAAAMDHAELLVELTGGNPGFRALRAFVLTCAGQRPDAEQELGVLMSLPALPEIGRYYAALTLLYLGDYQQAMAKLDEELAAHNSMAIYLGVDPALRMLHGDPRFQQMRARVGV